MTCHQTDGIYKTRVKSLFFKTFTRSYHRRILFTDFSSQARWEVEENFRIMKTEFEAHPVYVRRDDRIKAHFMTCYISLLIYRLLEKKLEDNYTSHQIIETLRSMQLTLLSTANGYIPSYQRTELTDALHKTFGFRTDYEFITKSSMRTIIKETKQSKQEEKKI